MEHTACQMQIGPTFFTFPLSRRSAQMMYVYFCTSQPMRVLCCYSSFSVITDRFRRTQEGNLFHRCISDTRVGECPIRWWLPPLYSGVPHRGLHIGFHIVTSPPPLYSRAPCRGLFKLIPSTSVQWPPSKQLGTGPPSVQLGSYFLHTVGHHIPHCIMGSLQLKGRNAAVSMPAVKQEDCPVLKS